jgi:dextranase
MKTRTNLIFFFVFFLSDGCMDSGSSSSTNPRSVYLSTDKAVYYPNDIVTFSVDKNLSSNARIRYRALGQTISESNFSSKTWTWRVPADDFKGYLVDLYSTNNGTEVVYGSLGVDVSSDWTKFPRYGFLSKFPLLDDNDMNAMISTLTRYHINGLQFYDWEEKDHKPLAGTMTNPTTVWSDIANRTTYGSTVKGYIAKAKQAGMKPMSYNLCYGALNDAANDGVLDGWYAYIDQAHSTKAKFDVPGFLKSPIYLLDPSNADWQQYIATRNSDMYSVYEFDGYHIDQLGSQGTVFTYTGAPFDFSGTFNSFIQSMKKLSPGKRLVFNAVNQYGQPGVATAPLDFLYTEVWSPNDTYADLTTIIADNDALSGNNKKTVLAAYMNYAKADNAGTFNTPSILFTDAVIFAFGGAHLELGEHMLGKEYFPNSNLQMTADLIPQLITYYDFSVAYQNLLRDGGAFNSPQVSITDNSQPIGNWPAQQGKIAVVGKLVGSSQVIHLFNFINNSTDWRDTNGTKSTPIEITNIKLSVQVSNTISKVWVASPDVAFGTANQLTFQQIGNTIDFTLPSLNYWDMIVIE